MEKNNGKIVAVVALVVAVVSLSVGFAAFAATLTIDSNATVKANDEFSPNVNYVQGSPKCYYTGDTTKAAIDGASAGTASGKTWTGVSVPLTTEHKSVTCEAQISNTSAYVAKLNKISISDYLSCASVAASGDDAATNVSTICPTVSAKVDVATDTATFTSTNKADVTSVTSTIDKDNGTEMVYLTIAYTSTVAADGDIKITVPTISLLYKTA